MTNVSAFTSKQQLQQQASEWISKIDRGLSDTEKQQLGTWIGQSELHRQTLFELAELWDDLSALHELSGLFPLRNKEPQQRYLFSDRTRWAVAASMVLAILFSTSWVLNQQSVETQQPVLAYQASAQTLVGQQKPLTLPDGSVIHLNTDSQVKVEYTAQARRIDLQRGEAHFDVAHDTTRPFIVTAGNNTVTAVGTAFNVQLLQDKAFELLVTEGKVVVRDLIESMTPTISMTPNAQPLQGKGVFMTSGEKAHFAGKQHDVSSLSLDQVQRDLAWQQGMVVFQGEPLVQALAEVSRYTSVTFEIAQDDLKRKRVAGYFKAGDINGLLFALKNSFDIEHERIDDKRIRLTSN